MRLETATDQHARLQVADVAIEGPGQLDSHVFPDDHAEPEVAAPAALGKKVRIVTGCSKIEQHDEVEDRPNRDHDVHQSDPRETRAVIFLDRVPPRRADAAQIEAAVGRCLTTDLAVNSAAVETQIVVEELVAS